MSVAWYGKDAQHEGICCYNIDLLEFLPEHAVASEQRAAILPAQIGLSAQQMDIISSGVDTYLGLRLLIHKQRNEVMGLLSAADEETAISGSEHAPQASTCSAASQVSAISSDLETLSGLQQRQQRLETQQQLAARFQLLMAKE